LVPLTKAVDWFVSSNNGKEERCRNG